MIILKHKQIIDLISLMMYLLSLAGCQRSNITLVQTSPTPSPMVVRTGTIQPSSTLISTIKPIITNPTATRAFTATPLISSTMAKPNVIAFTGTGDDPNNEDIYIINLNNLKLVNITQNPAADMMPAWSPDGTKIAFISSRNNNNLQLFIMNPDGSGAQQITTGEPLPLHRPSWSPDGLKIAFDAQNPDNSVGIYVVNVNTKILTTLINDSSDNFNPAWSPDGTKIAFSSNRAGPGVYDVHLYVLDLVTNHIKQLTNDQERDWSPDWSPNGNQIAFTRFINGWPYLYLINADGSDLREIIPAKINADQEGGGNPSWSGDGSMIAFQDSVPIEEGPILKWLNSVWISSIFIINSDGSGTIRLTSGNVFAEYPDWRP
jgi:Tol biopolymer transport system component